jgi:hypothetical protein
MAMLDPFVRRVTAYVSGYLHFVVLYSPNLGSCHETPPTLPLMKYWVTADPDRPPKSTGAHTHLHLNERRKQLGVLGPRNAWALQL